jgi:hypothetical protein
VASRALVTVSAPFSGVGTTWSIRPRLAFDGKVTMQAELAVPDHETIRELVRLPSSIHAPVPAYDPYEPRLARTPDCKTGKNLIHLLAGFTGRAG